MVRDARLREAEKRAQRMFAEIDHLLEKEYGGRYPLHPARPPDGATANPKYSGLFNIGAAFSAGFGSKYGPGYVLEVRMVTLHKVPREVRNEIEERVVALVREALPRLFPERELQVERDGSAYKIFGDLRIGKL